MKHLDGNAQLAINSPIISAPNLAVSIGNATSGFGGVALFTARDVPEENNQVSGLQPPDLPEFADWSAIGLLLHRDLIRTIYVNDALILDGQAANDQIQDILAGQVTVYLNPASDQMCFLQAWIDKHRRAYMKALNMNFTGI